MQHEITAVNHFPSAGLLRRTAALIYDAFILCAVWMFATLLLLPWHGGHAFHAGNYLYSLYLLFIWVFFYMWFWLHGGQTIGMVAWRIRLLSADHQPLSWQRLLYRWLLAFPSLLCGGIGWWWQLLDKQQRTLHDIFSRTRVVQLTHSLREPHC